MNRQKFEIIPIERGELGLEVNSRLLHEKLNIGHRHNDWIRRRIQEYGFVEGRDFLIKLLKTGGRPAKDYILTLDTAEELAMRENNEAGRMIRQYFIEIEKRYRDWVSAKKLEIQK